MKIGGGAGTVSASLDIARDFSNRGPIGRLIDSAGKVGMLIDEAQWLRNPRRLISLAIAEK